MSNVYSLLSTGNTFGDLVVTINGLAKENNDLAANSYHKSTGTLYLDEPTTSLQANGISIFSGYLHSTGVSGAQVDYNLTVQGQTYLTNTILSLTTSGQANMNGLLIAQGPGTSLFVANNANVQGNVAIVGNTSIGNNLFVTSNTTSQNTYTLGTTVTLGNTYTNTLQSNVFVNTALLTVTGPAYVAFLQANNFVNTALVTVTGNVYANIIQANTSVNTSLVTVTGTTYTNALQANSSVNTALLTVTGTSYTNLLQANTSVNTSLITVTGTSYTNSLQANTSVNTSLITVTGNTYSSNVIANTSLLVKGTTVLTGTANTLADLGIGGNLNVPNSLFMGNSTSSANIYSLTVGQSVGNGGLTVQGNFIIASPILYQAPSFTLYGSTPITGGNYANFSVYRTGANASIRWDETNKYWGILNVTSTLYNQILTGEQLSNLGTDTSTFNVATAYALSTANTFLQANAAATLSTAKAYANTIVAANVITLQSQIAANVTSLQGQIAANVVTIQGQIAANVTSLQGQISSNISLLSSSANASNLTTGTIPAARLPNSGVTVNTYGGTTQIPVLQIDATGRVTTASNTAISSTLPISGNTGTGSISLLTQTLNVNSGNTSVITTSASGQTITISPVVSGVTAGSYGSATAIPVLTVDTFGRVQTLTTSPVSTTINLTGTSGTGNVSGGGTLTFTGNYGVTVSVSGSTANVSTPQDLRTSAAPSFYNLALSTPLVVSSGGTGVTSSTGSGNNVLSISPTLITPNIGTPSSGNLVNCINYGGAITPSQVLGALGYTPYSASNPNSYITISQAYANTIAQGYITSSGTAALAQNLTGTPNISVGTITATSSSGNPIVINYTGNGNYGLKVVESDTTYYTIFGGAFAQSQYQFSILTNNAGTQRTFIFATDGSFTAPGNITAYSDARLKSNITNITGALDLVNSMRGVRFDKDGKRGLGVIAQEVQQVLPELVHENDDENKTLSVAYGNMAGVFIEAIKELSEQVKELKAEIEILKGNK
jgi:hypothetical protein